jgi:hypothetical protein
MAKIRIVWIAQAYSQFIRKKKSWFSGFRLFGKCCLRLDKFTAAEKLYEKVMTFICVLR